jgi:hypothetical protein
MLIDTTARARAWQGSFLLKAPCTTQMHSCLPQLLLAGAPAATH